MDPAEMLLIGERNYAIRRVLAGRDGYSRKDDRLPPRFSQPIPEGPSAGEWIPRESLEGALDEYFELRGFDDDGPTEDKLRQLQLEDLIDAAGQTSTPEEG